jgi:hypothetical protein
MKTLVFIAIALSANIAFANTQTPTCDDLSILYTSQLQNINASDRAEAFNNIEQTFNLLCKQQHVPGSRVFYPNKQLAADNYNTEGATVYYPNGSVAMETDADGMTVWYYPTGEMVTDESADYVSDMIYGIERKAAKIEAPFKAQHAKCAPGCTYVSWGIWGDEAHKKRRSCHNSGEAIDIHAITCGGKQSAALSAKFDKYVACMKGKFKVLYRQKDHFGHAHIQIPNCKMIKLK